MTLDRPNLADLLLKIRSSPEMYLGGGGIHALGAILTGYGLALETHGIIEDVPDFSHFSAWLAWSRGWTTSIVWPRVIELQAGNEDPLGLCFELVSEFMALAPTVCASTENRGHRIVVCRYSPATLYFEMVETQPGKFRLGEVLISPDGLPVTELDEALLCSSTASTNVDTWLLSDSEQTLCHFVEQSRQR